MKNGKLKAILFAALSAAAASAGAQTTASSLSTVALKRGTTPVYYNIGGTGLKSSIRWGMDTAWDSEANVQRGVNFIGQDNLTLGRASFQPSDLITDGKLSDSQLSALKSRLQHLSLMGAKSSFDVLLNCDHEALTLDNYSPDYRAIVANWAALIDATTRQTQELGYNVIAVAPFNEPDYGTGLAWGWKEGNEQDFLDISKLLRTDYKSTFENIAICGGNTLNCDNALSWYNTLKNYLEMGNTHQLAGSFDSYANFFTQVVEDGKTAVADELHNVGEAIVGQQYGMSMGIWWGFDGVARGQFCRATSSVNPGTRIGYGEDRDSWTSAAVYNNAVDGTTEAFLGSSERQATDHSFEFISADRDVYYDGRGPLRQFTVDMPGGTGYSTGQTNAERLVNIQYGTDVPRREITSGKYIIMNRNSKKVLQPSGGSRANGNTVTTATRTAGSEKQEWTLDPVDSRISGDFSYYSIKSDTFLLDNKDWSLIANTNAILYAGDGGNVEQWYLKYAGDGYYYIVNRHSGMYLCQPTSSTTVVQQALNTTSRNNYYQQWRIMPTTNNCETIAPAKPTNLTATANSHSIVLEWTASTASDACGYTIFRATDGEDDWNTIARGVEGTSFVDNSVKEGVTYIYKVKTLDTGDNLSLTFSNEASACTTSSRSLIAHWSLDNTLEDKSENRLDAVSYGNTIYMTGHGDGTQKAANFTGSNFLQVPYSVGSLDAMTFSAWVKPTSASSWQRIFDFGNGTDQYIFLASRDGNSKVRLAIKNGGEEEQLTTNTQLANYQWSHVAVTFGDGKAAIWINGEKVAEGSLSAKMSDFNPVRNFLGCSQFSSDAIFKGAMQDVQLYNYVLSDDDIASLYSGGTVSGISLPEATSDASSNNVRTRHDIIGRKVGKETKGIVIETLGNGSSRKVLNR